MSSMRNLIKSPRDLVTRSRHVTAFEGSRSVLRVQVFECFLYSEFQIFIDPGSVTHIPQFKRICVEWIKPSNYANSQQTLFWPAGGMHDCVNIDTFHIKDFFFLFCHGFLFDKSWSCDFGFKFTLNHRQYVWSCV